MSVFFTDTDCEMDYTTAEELNISVIGMPYTIMDKESVYDYGKNTDIKEFFNLILDHVVVKDKKIIEIVFKNGLRQKLFYKDRW